MKKYHIVTYGCQMNVHDTERMRAILEREGLQSTDNKEDADVVIFNTCSVRLKAEEKFYTALGRLKSLKKKKPDLKIIAAGCTAQVAADEIMRRAPYTSGVIGTRAISRLPEMLRELEISGKTRIETELSGNIFDSSDYKDYADLYSRPSPVRAYITIMEGCNNFCSYCIVPYTRGREISRPWDQVLNEVRALADKGYIEVILLGQNVNSYNFENRNFADLLSAVSDVKGLKRIRFVTSHPAYFGDDMIDIMAERENICSQLHLPLQAGSNVILEQMNRKYTLSQYLTKIGKLKERVKDISLSADIIVGYPGETEEDYKQTLNAIKHVRYDQVFSFVYSSRPGTKAAKLEDNVPLEVKKERLIELQAAQRVIQLESNKNDVGKTLKTLVDGFSAKDNKILSGRVESNKVVNFNGDPEMMDKMVDVEITGATQNSLIGIVSRHS